MLNQDDGDGGGASQTTAPAAGTSTATDVSLRDHVDALFNNTRRSLAELDRRVEQKFDLNDKALQAALLAAKEAVAAALTAAKEAVDKAEAAAAKRFEATNEFRGQLADQATTFQRRDVANAELMSLRSQIEANRVEIAAIRTAIATLKGRDSGVVEQENTHRADSQARTALFSLTAVVVFGLAGVLVAVLLR